ncbi:MAG: endolytic transglycosylase MltG [Propionicimonas sp.]|uniref:endolytic transglycosylase MltG n=1 Tax=Propionicimonas sp. TaxID=1955623 RepID=UPI002B201514|nr:endolytic transglycosylase MltG [Propionicimonas sp.]MEA4943113.1 endolytic transglycosylase MltG [Propionicimonas sp.]MEA5052419.1 endolytic transglycosylase MltG [Propionicimonas sp.]
MSPRRAIEPTESERPGFVARHKGGIAVLVALLVLVGAAGGVFVAGRGALDGFFAVPDYPGPGGDQVQVSIPRGATLTEMGEILAEADVVASASAFTRAAAQEPDARSIQPGTYLLRTQLPAATAVKLLLDDTNLTRSTFTLREGATASEQLAVMAEKTGLDLADFEAVVADVDSLGLPDWGEDSVEGFLFPDTYAWGEDDDAASVVALATDEFSKVADSLDFEAGAHKLGVTPLEALTVASIVEKEVFREQDRPKVARVIYNRLDQGMKLQLDSTVAYLAGVKGTVWTTEEQRDSDSPYNTYKHKGLPPGPISSPSKASLEAALSPAKGDWLFFVPVNLDTGETKFTSSYAEHQKAVAELHAWCAASDANRKKCA